MSALEFGPPKVNAISGTCCGKPVGCNMTHHGCVYLKHPWKRAMVFHDRTVRCQAKGVDPATHEPTQCVLLNGHDGGCEL